MKMINDGNDDGDDDGTKFLNKNKREKVIIITVKYLEISAFNRFC